MKRYVNVCSSILLILAFLIWSPAYAIAAPLLTQLGGNSLIVPDGKYAESVMVVGTDVRIAGSVSDVVLVINGNVHLEPTAKVELVIDLGGHVSNFSSNNIRDGIFELNLTQPFLNSLFVGGALLFGVWFLRLLLSLAGIVLLTGSGYLVKKHLARAESLLATSTLRICGIGAASQLVIVALVILFSLTIAGIPLAIVLLLVSVTTAFWGTLPIINLLGEKVLSQRLLESPKLTRLLIQSIIFVSVANIPVLGFIFLVIVGSCAQGLALTHVWIYLKQRKKP